MSSSASPAWPWAVTIYVTKPFSLDEVLERIRAVLRRTGRAVASPRLRVADLELDEDGHEVRRDGTPIALTPTEFRLLRFLAPTVTPAAGRWPGAAGWSPV